MQQQKDLNYILQFISFIIAGIITLAGILLHFDEYLDIIFLFGLYMIITVYYRLAADTKSRKLLCMTGINITCLIFCIVCPEWFVPVIFLTLYNEITDGNSILRKFLYISRPPLIFLILRLIDFNIHDLPYNLLAVIVLVLISSMAFAALQLLNRFREADFTYRNSIILTSVNELKEKELNRKLSLQNYLIDRNARLEERDNISRSIHNVIGHTITAAIMALDASELLYEADPLMARDKAATAKERMHESLASIRRVVRVLDDGTDNVSVTDLSQTLIDGINQFTIDTDIKIRHNLAGGFEDIMIPSKHAEFLYGAMLEALSNGVRHGRATAFIILLNYDKRHLKLTVQDNGKAGTGDSAAERDKLLTGGYGLKKLEQYLRSCGGELKLINNEGFTVVMTLPIN